MVKHLPHISIEKYAAYLDGNLPDEEMQQMKAFIDTDADMQAVLEADSSIGADLDLDLLENDPAPFEMVLPSVELPSIDAASPFENNSILEDFFSLDGDRFWEEMSSILNDDASHHELLNENGDMNINLKTESDSIDLAANEDTSTPITETSHDWGIHDGDYGYLEMGLPPVITQDSLTNNELMTPSIDDGL